MGMKKFLLGLVGIVCALFTLPSWGACNLFNMDWLLNAPNWTKNGDVYSGSADTLWSTYTSGGQHFPMTFATNTQYTFSGHVGANPANARFSIIYTDGTDYKLFFGIDRDFSYTSSAGKTISRVVFGNGASGNIQLSNIQVEEGTTATPYTPYDATCIERCKNLFDGELAIGGLLFANGAVTNETQYLYSIRSIPVIPNTSYVLSADTSKIKKGEVYFYKNNGEYNGHISDSLKNLPIAFTTPEDTYQVKFILMGSGENLQPSDATNVQLEQGDTATAYVPYVAACHKIQVATTKYVESQFSGLSASLANAVATVNTVVTQTIAQAASIATLQSGKQTRPADNTECPAYKQCLLVEDESGTPHWYEITDPFRDFVAPIVGANISPTEESAFYDAGYQQLEYIESTGTQYIDTGLTTSAGTTEIKVVTDFTLLGINTDVSSVILYISSPNSGLQAYIYKGGSAIYNQTVTAGQVRTDVDYIMETVTTANMRSIQLNGGQVFSQTFDRSITDNSPIYTFGSPDASGTNSCMIAKIRNQKFYRNGTLVRNFIPVRKNEYGTIGMYDTVNGVFYTNQGTGSFVAGPVVENDANVPAPQWRRDWNANSQYNLSAGKVYGTAQCNNISGTQEHGQTATSSQTAGSEWLENGAKCWCKVVGIEANNEYTKSPSTVPWVFDAVRPSVADCNKMCAAACSNRTLSEPWFRKTLFGM